MDFKSKVRDIDNEIWRQMRFIDTKEIEGKSFGVIQQFLRREIDERSKNLEESIIWRCLITEQALKLERKKK